MDNISFQGRNTDIRRAYKILNKINTGFPSVCPWKINRISDKYNGENVIGCPISQEKLAILRDHTSPDFVSNYKYAAKIIEAVDQFKSANCKELSELGYLIAKTNNIQNCYCANLYGKIPGRASELKDFGHSILLITPKPIKKPKFSNKYYVNHNVSTKNAIIPNDKTIVVDAVTGIVDYWKNAIIKYAQTPLNEISSNKEVRVNLREPLLKSEKDIAKIKKEYPILDFSSNSDKIKRHYKFRKAKRELNYFKKLCPGLEPCPAYYEEPKGIGNKIWSKIKSFF